MRLAQTLVVILFAGMSAALLYGFARGDFAGDVTRLLAIPWGAVSLVDVYTGFLLFAGWIIYREHSLGSKLAWVVALIILGNWIACIYVWLALRQSGGDARRFWLGDR